MESVKGTVPDTEQVSEETHPPTPAQPSKGESLATKIGLAVLTFVLGLIASYITNFYFTPQKEGSYAISYSKLITTSNDIPSDLPITKDLIATAKEVTRIDLQVENIGKTEIPSFNVLCVLSKDAELLSKTVWTTPVREVPFVEEAPKNINELRVSGITLEPQQQISVRFYVKSAGSPALSPYFSGGGGPVAWVRSGFTSAGLSLQESVLATARNFVLALVIPGFIGAIPTFFGMLLYGVNLRRSRGEKERYLLWATGVAPVFASLVRILLYLRTLQSGLPILRHFVS